MRTYDSAVTRSEGTKRRKISGPRSRGQQQTRNELGNADRHNRKPRFPTAPLGTARLERYCHRPQPVPGLRLGWLAAFGSGPHQSTLLCGTALPARDPIGRSPGGRCTSMWQFGRRSRRQRPARQFEPRTFYPPQQPQRCHQPRGPDFSSARTQQRSHRWSGESVRNEFAIQRQTRCLQRNGPERVDLQRAHCG